MAKNNSLNLVLITISGLIAGLLNYIYHPLILQYISIEDFGIFGSLVGIFNILGVLITGLVLFLNKQISISSTSPPRVKHLFIDSLKIFSGIGLFIFGIYLLCTPMIDDFLKLNDIVIIMIVGLTIIIGFIRAVLISTIRGIRAFKILAIEGVITPLIKLFLGFALVAYGYTYYGAIIGLLASGIIMIVVLTGYLLSYFGATEKIGSTQELLKDFYTQKKEIFHFFLLSAAFAIFMNIDVILAKNIFDDTTAGIYAGISILGKFLIFLLFSIETVYYGQIMEHSNKKIPLHLIRNPIILIIVTGVLALIVNFFIGSFILSILKDELANYTNIYLLILVFYSLLALISFFTKVLIAWGKYYVNYVMLFFTFLLFTIVYTFGINSLENFVYSFIAVGGTCTIVTSLIFFYEYNKQNKQIL